MDPTTADAELARLLQEEELRSSISGSSFLPFTAAGSPKDLDDSAVALRIWTQELAQAQTEEDALAAKQLEEEMQGPGYSNVGLLDPYSASRATDTDDPTPDIRELFQSFDREYFGGKLASVECRWSAKMTLCAGMCYYFPGGYCSVRLSEPLLKFRPRSDVIDTLLHEMIHAYLFLTNGSRDRSGHGPDFLAQAARVNALAGSKITVYHTFRDEVDHYRTHVWRCGGPCKEKPPFFGYVKRAMNRAPQPADRWWADHQKDCGGVFVKIAGPDLDKGDGKEGSKGGSKEGGRARGKKVDGAAKNTKKHKADEEREEHGSPVTADPLGDGDRDLSTAEKRHKAGPMDRWVIRSPSSQNRDGTSTGDPGLSTRTPQINSRASPGDLVECPVCGKGVETALVNEHLDGCLL
ncbi:hypothetical protein M427DRAFT_141323 [Gonapodya prolifera JEL478]|uniref:Protein with SprT-like domain at the N terminus n=1 Tax=Gonapodya prolifera (strain JEL478) TaxID=1344416 RepID=A0A138ZXI7_GONPJ|nr:hypothetical protein M427DRAFT_141323 [Gonapodya prolifera JEL478]|eukprot:KXS09184.1 hypothetical protein M427DRAFT_141323 [Gonapodya prolifera JEL478]